MNPMRSGLLIEYNGVDATDIIAKDCSSFTWKDNASGSADTLTLDLSNLNQKWMNGFFPSEHDEIKAWIQLQEWAADFKEGKLYCGAFAVDSLKFSGYPEKLSLSGISVPINTDFNVKQKNRTWESTTVKNILGDIAANARIELVYDADDVSVKSTNQNDTDLSFSYSLCKEYDLALKLYNNKMVVYDQREYESKTPAYTIKKDSFLSSYGITKQITSVYDSVKIQYSDGDSTLSYEYVVPGSAGTRQMFVSAKAESYRDAEKKAKAKLRENIRNSRVITLKMMGSAKYVASDVFQLEGFGKLDGKYFIDSVVHAKSSGKYTITINAHLVCTDF